MCVIATVVKHILNTDMFLCLKKLAGLPKKITKWKRENVLADHSCAMQIINAANKVLKREVGGSGSGNRENPYNSKAEVETLEASGSSHEKRDFFLTRRLASRK